MSNLRRISLNLSAIDKTKLHKHENGNIYISLDVYDLEQPDKYGNTVSVSLSLDKVQIQAKKDNLTIQRTFLGSGKKIIAGQPLTQEDINNLDF